MPLNRLGLLLLALLITAPASRVRAEHPSERWEQDIQTFESLESELAPMPGCILFTGSSSIRMWDLDKHLPTLHAVNRGFGGSQMRDLLYYTDRLVIRHEPRVIVVYEGDNDIASGRKVEEVIADYESFAKYVHAKLPQSKIIFLSIKPSVAHLGLYPQMHQVNLAVAKYCRDAPYCTFLDVGSILVDDKGLPRAELFELDGLHLNDQGYKLWDKLITEAIKTVDPNPR